MYEWSNDFRTNQLEKESFPVFGLHFDGEANRACVEIPMFLISSKDSMSNVRRQILVATRSLI